MRRGDFGVRAAVTGRLLATSAVPTHSRPPPPQRGPAGSAITVLPTVGRPRGPPPRRDACMDEQETPQPQPQLRPRPRLAQARPPAPSLPLCATLRAPAAPVSARARAPVRDPSGPQRSNENMASGHEYHRRPPPARPARAPAPRCCSPPPAPARRPTRRGGAAAAAAGEAGARAVG